MMRRCAVDAGGRSTSCCLAATELLEIGNSLVPRAAGPSAAAPFERGEIAARTSHNVHSRHHRRASLSVLPLNWCELPPSHRNLQHGLRSR
jgi:hypothetical protein